jgi:YidC/Oxa1 family membrane protein insertase
MFICLAIFMAWSMYQSDKQKKHQAALRRLQNNNEAAVPPGPGAQGELKGAPNGAPSSDPAKAAAVEASPPSPPRPQHPVKEAVLESAESWIRLSLTSERGGGIREAHLPQYKNFIPKKGMPREDLVLVPKLAEGPSVLALGIESLSSGAVPAAAGAATRLPSIEREAWEMEVDEGARSVVFRNHLSESGAAEGGLAITRRLRLRPEKPDEPALALEVEFENRGSAALTFQYVLHGPGGLRSEKQRERGADLKVVVGKFALNGPLIVSSTPTGEKSSNVWSDRPAFIGVLNNYFAAVVAAVDRHGAPEEIAPMPRLHAVLKQSFLEPQALADLLQAKYQGRGFADLMPAERLEVEESGIRTARVNLVSVPYTLEPGQKLTDHYLVYLGPRKDALLERYDKLNLVAINDYGITTWIVKLFLGILQFFHWIIGSWGFAIVCLTLVVRSALHPINRRQQAGMMRYQKQLQKIQPQMTALKEKYQGDRLKMNQEMQKLFRENKINPFGMMGGCLMVFLQLPIWIGLIETLNYSIDLRQAPFLGWIEDLSRPDRLATIAHTIPLVPNNLNLLPILYVILMLVQQKMQPKPTDPQARQTQRTMTFMMVAFGFIFYDFASGLLVYFLTSAIFGLVESKIIKTQLAREDEAGGGQAAAGPAAPGGGSPAAVPSGGGALYQSSRAFAKPKKPKQQKRW